MEEHELRESLRRLPDARPGAEFTAEVLARVERDERRHAAGDGRGARDRVPGGASRWRPTLLVAGLAAALVAAAGLWQPPAGGGRLGGGGGEVVAPETAGAERLGEGGGQAVGGEGAASVEAVTEGLDEVAPHARGELADTAVAAAGAGEAPAVASSGAPEGASGVAPDGAAGAAPPAAGTFADADAVTALPGADFFAPPPAAADLAALPAAARLARLRTERESLERRLAAFRRELPPAEPPVVLLGGDDGFDLVFDLARWAAPPPAGDAAGAARPAVHSTQGPPRRF
jgi:hypothetical protein